MIHFSNLDKNYEEAIYNFLLINNFKSDLNNYYTKLMIMDNVMPIIKKFKVKKKNLNILEIGCGNGIHSIFLSTLGKVYSTDLTKTTITIGDNVESLRYKLFKKFDQKVIFKNLENDINPFKNKKFDIIFHNSVIEHVPNYKKFNKDIHKYLNKDGINVCITGTPNLCIYRFFKNYILRFPFIFIFAFLKTLLLTRLYNVKKFLIFFKKIEKKIWHFQPTHLILKNIANNIYKLNLTEDFKIINNLELKKYLPSLLHIIREPEYNRIVLKEISNKLDIDEVSAIQNYIKYFRDYKNEFFFNLLPQTHSQHTRNIFSEMKEWTIDSWKRNHELENAKIETIVGYRYQHIFGQSYNLRHKIFYRFIKLMNKYLSPKFSTEFIIITRKV